VYFPNAYCCLINYGERNLNKLGKEEYTAMASTLNVIKNITPSGKDTPKLAILGWEEGKVQKGFLQLEKLRGNSMNPNTYDFPVIFERIPGACSKTVVENPDPVVLQRMISKAKELQGNGICGITTSCGFNAIFQREIAKALQIPFFSSSLLQIPMMRAMYGKNRDLIVITSRKENLKPEHFKATGTTDFTHLFIYGVKEECEVWNKMTSDFDAEFDLEIFSEQFIDITRKAVKERPNAAAFVFECTDLPPFSKEVNEVTKLPVFDFVTMTKYIYSSFDKY